MNLPDSRRLQFTPELNICRILNGMWQVSGAHGAIAPQRAIQSMFDYFDAGFTTWDLADHYGPAEDFIGEFRRQISATRSTAVLPSLQAFTKWVPRAERMTRSLVEENIDISLRRMDVPSLDLLQFHWWEYCNKNYLDALKYLTELQHEGKITRLGLTNFDTEHLQIVLENDIPIFSDRSPSPGSYGTVLSEASSQAACLRHSLWGAVVRALFGTTRARAKRTRHSFVEKVQKHDRRVGWLGVISKPALGTPTDFPKAWGKHRQHCSALCSRPANGGRCDCGGAVGCVKPFAGQC
jgi:aryl-alcohol dehydrogenase-like predicted oxidoreductase